MPPPVARQDPSVHEVSEAPFYEARLAGLDTISVQVPGRGPLGIVSRGVEPGDEVERDDTLAVLVDSLTLIDLERLRLRIAFAEAEASADPADGGSSLSELLAQEESLERTSNIAFLSPAGGTVVSAPPAPGARIMPGSMLVRIAMRPESLFVLAVPAGFGALSWPGEIDGAALVESFGDSALYSGTPREGRLACIGAVSIPRQAVHETGLGSFVSSEGGDSIAVTRLMTDGTVVVVVPERPIQGRVLGWAEEGM